MNEHHWQDARLKKALQHAPDKDQEPSAQVREHILHTAARAVEPTMQKTTNWKNTFRQFFNAKSRMPWNAAWGTALLIVCVGMIWLFQDPKTAFEPQPPEHFPQQPVPATVSDEAPSLSTTVPVPEFTPAPVEIGAQAESARLDQAAATSPALPSISIETPEVARPAQPSTHASQPTAVPSLGGLPQTAPISSAKLETVTDASDHLEQSTPMPMATQSSGPALTGSVRSAQEQPSQTRSRQQENEAAKEDRYFEVPTPPPAPVAATPAPVTRPSTPSLIIAEEKTSEAEIQRRERNVAIATGSVTGSTTNTMPSAEDSSLRITQPVPNAFEQDITGNYGGTLFSSDTYHGHNQSASAEAITSAQTTPDTTPMADLLSIHSERNKVDSSTIQTAPAKPLPEALTTALQQWNYLQFTFEGRSYILHRDKSAPLPEILPRTINAYSVIDYLPEKDGIATILVFYASDKTTLGTLSIQHNGTWFFQHHQPSVLTGKLSENQRKQLEETFKTLVTQ